MFQGALPCVLPCAASPATHLLFVVPSIDYNLCAFFFVTALYEEKRVIFFLAKARRSLHCVAAPLPERLTDSSSQRNRAAADVCSSRV